MDKVVPGILQASQLVTMGVNTPFHNEMMEEFAVEPELPSKPAFPKATFLHMRRDKEGRRMPQTIAHRGYKAKHPENTMAAFRAAVEVGAHAVETDVHLTRDDVVVLSHDKTLKRCFGIDKRILDCDWKYIKELRTIREPHEYMPRLEDLLEYLAEPGNEQVWLMLDIKIDNNADNIMRLMAETVANTKPAKGTKWEDRILLGFWAAKYVPLCTKYFPDFAAANIGFSVAYSKQFLEIPNISFNMLQPVLFAPRGRKFITQVKEANRKIFSWTVNDTKMMEWCIERELDGIVTDDPEKLLDVCDGYDPKARLPWNYGLLWDYLRIMIMSWFFELLFASRYGKRKFETMLAKAGK